MLMPRIDAAAGGRAQHDGLIRLIQHVYGSAPVPLSDAAVIIKGDPSARKGSLPPGGIPIINTGIATSGHTSLHNHDGELVTVATKGSYCGWPKWWDGPVFISDALALEARPELAITKYLYYALESKKGELNRLKRGAMIPGLSIRAVMGHEIPLPPLEAQERAVRLLDGIGAGTDRTALNAEKLADCLAALPNTIMGEIFGEPGRSGGMKEDERD